MISKAVPSFEDARQLLVAMVLIQFSLSLLLSSSDGAFGFGAAAFPLHDSSTKTTTTAPKATIPSRFGEMDRESARQTRQGWRHSNRQVLLSTPTIDEDLNTTYSIDVILDERQAIEEEFSASARRNSMSLKHEGSHLKLSPNNNEPPITILDGLSPSVWTAVGAPTTPQTQSSFSSLVLQTQVPSELVQSLSLGNFMMANSKQEKHKFLAASRLNRYWMGPKFGSDSHEDSEIPVDTQYLLVEVERDHAPPYYAIMMPLIDGGYRSSLEPSSSSIDDNLDKSKNRLTLVSYWECGDNLSRNDPSKSRNALYVATHDDPYELLQMAFREVSGVLGGSFRTLDEKQIPTEFVNSFGWCSWDAFYSKVHPTGVLEGIECLSNAGIPVKNVILDDGWQQVSPPYLHQQEEDESKKKASIAAQLSLTGSSDIMPPEEMVSSVSSSGAAAMATTHEQASTSSSSLSLFATSLKSIFQNPFDAFASIGESIFGAIATGVSKFYQNVVENSPPNSFAQRLWTFLARHTPLNAGMWQFFDSETDFGRQLNDFPPNWKFLEENDDSSTASASETKNMDLRDLVHTLKNDWKVNKVYCWHSLHGYWRGVSDDLGKSIGIEVTQVKTRPNDHILRVEPEMAYDPPSLFGVGLIGKKDDLSKFYTNLHEPLVAAGVDGVKVDVQSGVTATGFSGFENCPPLAKQYTQSMEESVSSRFSSPEGAVDCINCMCHSTENLYRYQKTAIARASDDFYPARPESHSVHLVNVAYNSLFVGEICLPDWDMFHSQHASAELHAAARAIGGCPIYVSDKPGQHNIELLKKLVLPDGSVLRAQKAGRPTRDCLFADVGKDGVSALKVWNVNREPKSFAKGIGGVLGAFNVQGVAWNFESNENEIVDASPLPVKAVVRPHDVEVLRDINGPFAVWSYRSQSIEILENGDSTIEKTIHQRDWEIFTIQPVQRDNESGVTWAPIGLANMLNSGGAILDVSYLSKDDSNRIQADITTRGPGKFVSYCQPSPSNILLRNGLTTKQIDFEYNEQDGTLEFTLPEETIEGKAHLVTVLWEI